jgi:hypothetical protein
MAGAGIIKSFAINILKEKICSSSNIKEYGSRWNGSLFF